VAIDLLSTLAAVGLAILLAWGVGPTLGHWSAQHPLARFSVGLLTELRMLPILAALVPLLSTRSGLPAPAVIGLFAGASRAAAIARWTSQAELADRTGTGGEFAAIRPRYAGDGFRPHGAAAASLLAVTVEIALLEGLTTLFGAGQGSGLGAALVRGNYTALVPLLALTWASTVLLERRPARPWRRARS
jgi:hypothetical protein